MKILITGGSGFIGTNLVEKFKSSGHYVLLNLDKAKPKCADHLEYWKPCDILDKDHLLSLFHSFKPHAVIHLAGRTDTDAKNTLADYEANTIGSENVLYAIKATPGIERAILTSTQFVNQYQGMPKDDEDFAPHTVYGESKVIMEKMIRKSGLKCRWTIIRPTNIWGPWHIRYPYEFWKVLSKGLYFHPGKKPVVRSYGYVGNVVFQIISILESPPENVDHEVFYVGDEPIDIYHWVNGFSLKQTGKKVKVVPRVLVRMLALVGDGLSVLNLPFPLTSSRYKSMTCSNVSPMEKTLKLLGQPPYSLDEGVAETVNWMKIHFPELIRIKLD